MPQEGFIHNGRTVFSLLYRLECTPPEIRELIVPLNSDGNAIGPIWSIEHGKRFVNVHPGEKIMHQGAEYTVQTIEVFRSLPLESPGMPLAE